MEAKEISSNSGKNAYYIFYLILSIAWGFLVTFVNTQVASGFLMKLVGAIGGSVGGFLGFLIADFIRKLIIPDMIFTTGGFLGLLKARLFWMCGPQLIGIAVGGILFMSMIVEMK
jgi:hypothetical protein